MANESAVREIGQLETTIECDGCGKALNLLTDHLVVQSKVKRQVLVTVDAADVDTKEAAKLAKDSDTGVEMYYLGVKSGAGEQVIVHNWTCFSDVISDREEISLEIHRGVEGDED